MTRKSVYYVAMVAFLAASTMTLTAIIVPRWISWDTTTPSGAHTHQTYGLHRICSSLPSQTHTHCVAFPAQYTDCAPPNRTFCSLWRTVGWLMSFAVVLEGMTFVVFLAILAGSREKRESGWRVLVSLLLLTAMVHGGGMGIIAWCFDHDGRFFDGWKLDVSWALCTGSMTLLVLVAVGVLSSAYLLRAEDGYELIPDRAPEQDEQW